MIKNIGSKKTYCSTSEQEVFLKNKEYYKLHYMQILFSHIYLPIAFSLFKAKRGEMKE